MTSTFTAKEILRVAQNQRIMLFAILISLLNAVVMFLGILPPPISGILNLVIVLCVAVFFVKLRNAMKANIALTVLSIICMVIPLLSLLILLFNNQTATKILKGAGLKVGLMGVSSADLQKFVAASNLSE